MVKMGEYAMFHGSLVALVTPMKANGDIDYPNLERLVAWHLENETDGLVVLGTTGESATIEPDERAKIIAQVVSQVNEKISVIIGTGTNATVHAIELTRQAMEAGADAALLVTPYYNKPTQEGLFQHYKTIAKAVPIPQILYNVPSRTGCDLMPETVARLSQLSNIVALKEATPDVNRLKRLLELECSMDMLSGDDATAMEFILAGGKGVVSVAANIMPKAMHRMCGAALKGDRKSSEELNKKLEILYQHLFVESNPIPAKWVLAEMGLIEAGIRLPLTPLDKKYHDDLRGAMKEAKVHI